jgi:tetratricopeptide (TPR) repeat protein
MRVTVEPYVPYDESLPWRLHHAYFQQRGPAAWTLGEVPSQATSNLGQARQHAAFLSGLVKDLEASGALSADDEVWVLEGGCGSGQFAANFIAALDELEGAPENAPVSGLASRVRYVISDYAERNIRDVMASERIAPLVNAGRVIPATYDLRDPQRIRLVDGGTLTRALTMFIGNYLCCVLPMKQVQRRETPDGPLWSALWIESRADVTDPALASPDAYERAITEDATRANLLRDLELHFDWRPLPPGVSLATHVGDEVHAQILAKMTDGLPLATVGYPVHYLDFMRAIEPLLVEGGAIVTNDYGSTRRERLEGAFERRPQQYGNSLAQDVNFTVFDAFAAVAGFDILRTNDDLDSLHTAALTPHRFGPHAKREFGAQRVWGRQNGDNLLDFVAVARSLQKQNEHSRALRFWLRCVAIDPYVSEFRYRLGETALDAGFPRVALEHLSAGLALDPTGWDWEFMLGRAACVIDDNATAIAWYERSLVREPHPVTYTNLGSIHQHLGRLGEAWQCYKAALELDPNYKRANERMDQLRQKVWNDAVSSFEKAPAPPRPGGRQP